MSLQAIAALSPNRVIGANGEIPWKYPVDMRKFKELTSGGVVIMGRKTYESIGKPLPNRVNVVLSTRPFVRSPLLFTTNSVEETLHLIRKLNLKKNFVIGGERVYRDFLPHCDGLILTHIPDDVIGDTYFPEFRETFRSQSMEDLGDGLTLETLTNETKDALGTISR